MAKGKASTFRYGEGRMIGTVHYVLNYQPGDGTKYDFCIYEDPYGGYIVTWPTQVTYRAYVDRDCSIEMKYLHGKKNSYTEQAMRDCIFEMAYQGAIM